MYPTNTGGFICDSATNYGYWAFETGTLDRSYITQLISLFYDGPRYFPQRPRVKTQTSPCGQYLSPEERDTSGRSEGEPLRPSEKCLRALFSAQQYRENSSELSHE